MFLADMKLSYLFIANNQLCYSVAYSSWATNTDSMLSVPCQNCVSPCQNGGTCIVSPTSMTCTCPQNWFGDTCTNPNPNGCGAGLGYSSTGNCTSCLAGTFSLTGISCVPCQVGTASSQVAAPSPTSCTPCGLGQYSSAPGSKTCISCSTNRCTTIGSIIPSPSPPSEVAFNMTILDGDGNLVTAASPFIVGLVYVGLCGGFVLISGLIAIIFQKKLRRVVLASAVILRTPAAILRVADSSNKLEEEPSFYRGIVGIWVLGGVILVTAYQINIFITQGRTELTAVQPGTVFTNGSSTSSAGTPLTLSLVLFQTPITCNTTAFNLTFSALDSRSLGLLSDSPTSCVVDPTFPSLTVTYAFPAPLSFTSASSVVFSATSANQSPLLPRGLLQPFPVLL